VSGDPVARARRATDEILAAMESAPRGVVVDSPPGAGKSTLVVRAAGELVGRGHRVMVIAQTNEQVDDLTDALATRLAGSDVRIGRLTSGTWVISERVTRHVGAVSAAKTTGELVGCHVVLSTAHKWATVRSDEQWPWAIIDEAYQMRSDLLLRVAGLFEKAFFGRPGRRRTGQAGPACPGTRR